MTSVKHSVKSKIKIALVGYGKMGREIDGLCRDSENFEVVSISFRKKVDGLDLVGIAKADVAIDFTSKDAVLKNIEEIAKLGVNVVVGTTGWHEQLDLVKKIVTKNKVGLIYSPNFSVGVNIFFKMIDFSAKLFNKFPEYEPFGLDIHHKAKLDSPSGTALKIAGKVKNLEFASIRAGRNPGFHQVVFESSADAITLSHQAYSRVGFAQGALVAAEFIKNKKGMYTFDDVFK